MPAIIPYSKINNFLSKIKQKKKKIVLVGGCFDIIHIGHIEFLKHAKKYGSILVVLLESDMKLKILKGENRPLFNQKIRAKVLLSLTMIDYVILLPYFKSDNEYTTLIKKIHPQIIAITQYDPLSHVKQKQADMIFAQIVTIPHIDSLSTSDLAHILGIE